MPNFMAFYYDFEKMDPSRLRTDEPSALRCTLMAPSSFDMNNMELGSTTATASSNSTIA